MKLTPKKLEIGVEALQSSIMTEEKANIENMKKCPRFEECSIPLCPLDMEMDKRVEMPEDAQCPLRRIITIGKHKKRIKGILSARMRGISNFIPDKNRK